MKIWINVLKGKKREKGKKKKKRCVAQQRDLKPTTTFYKVIRVKVNLKKYTYRYTYIKHRINEKWVLSLAPLQSAILYRW